jgi:chromosome segregation ATPase
MVDHENRETDRPEDSAAEGATAAHEAEPTEPGSVDPVDPIDPTPVEATEAVATGGETGTPETIEAAEDIHVDAANGGVQPEAPAESEAPVPTPADSADVPDLHAEEHQPDEVHALEQSGEHPPELQESTEPAGDPEHETAEQGEERERKLAENLQSKEALIARAEELKESTDWKATAEAIKRLQAEWKAIGPVPKEGSQELWDRFRAPANLFFERRQEHLAKLREEQEENLRKKEALCVRAEELAGSAQWKATAEALQALQAEWKTIGPVPREHGDAIWKRFRKSLDEFFGRRQEHYTKLRKEQEESLRKKEALCVRAEELSQSTQWKATSEAIKTLQAEWKSIGPVPQKKADAIWRRFRGAIDVFFERQSAYFEQRNSQRDQRDAERRDQMLDALERKREQTHRLRESVARDEENVRRWQATLTGLRPDSPATDETRVSLEGKIVDVESRLSEKRARLDELEKSIQEIAAKLSSPPPKSAPAAAPAAE